MSRSSSRSSSRGRKHKKRKHQKRQHDESPRPSHRHRSEKDRRRKHEDEDRYSRDRDRHSKASGSTRHRTEGKRRYSRSESPVSRRRFKSDPDVKPDVYELERRVKVEPEIIQPEAGDGKKKPMKKKLYLPGNSPEPVRPGARPGRIAPGAMKPERDWTEWERNRTRDHGGRPPRGGRRSPRGRGRRPDRQDDRRHDRRTDDDRRANDRARRDDHERKMTELDAAAGPSETEPPKEGVDFGLSGKLTEDTNTYKGVVIKYNEPAEARKPKRRWRLYPFKGDEALSVLHIHRQSAFLFGKDRRIADLPIDHPSCSKQHAVLQYRAVPYERPDGSKGLRVRPYIIDLGSSNKTFLNNQPIDPQRYYELKEKDVLKFGFSTREYVLLHEKTDTAELAADDEDTD